MQETRIRLVSFLAIALLASCFLGCQGEKPVSRLTDVWKMEDGGYTILLEFRDDGHYLYKIAKTEDVAKSDFPYEYVFGQWQFLREEEGGFVIKLRDLHESKGPPNDKKVLLKRMLSSGPSGVNTTVIAEINVLLDDKNESLTISGSALASNYLFPKKFPVLGSWKRTTENFPEDSLIANLGGSFSNRRSNPKKKLNRAGITGVHLTEAVREIARKQAAKKRAKVEKAQLEKERKLRLAQDAASVRKRKLAEEQRLEGENTLKAVFLSIDVEDSQGFACIAISPDGKWIAARDYDWTIRIWDSLTGKQTHRFGPIESAGQNSYSTSIAFSFDSKRIVSGGSSGIHVWDVVTGEEKLSIQSRFGRLTSSVAFSRDGRQIASGEGIVWDSATGQEVMRIGRASSQVFSVSFNSDGKRLAFSGLSPQVLNLKEGTKKQFGKHRNQINSMVFGPDGLHLFCGDRGGNVKVWDTMTGKELKSHASPRAGTQAAWRTNFSGDGNRFALGFGSTTKVCDTQTGHDVFVIKGLGVPNLPTCLALNQEGNLLITTHMRTKLKGIVKIIVWRLPD